MPSIMAANEHDAYVLQGYLTAQDRLFQMEYSRREASGHLSELLGKAALDSDIEARRLGLDRAAAAHAASLPDQDRWPLEAYAHGVNLFLDAHRDALPLECRVLGLKPAPWTVKDSILVYLQFYRLLSHSPGEETAKEELLAAGEPGKVQFLLPVRSGGEAKSGSNGWAIAGSRTKSGKPLLASDPHLLHSEPEFWYRAHLHGGRLHASGVSIPGLPGIFGGQNEKIAWGLTNLVFDLEDLYIERGAPVRVKEETIHVRGQKDVNLRVPVFHHGPELLSSGAKHYAVRWTATETVPFAYVIPAINRARNWAEFRQALSRHPGPSLNWVYADTSGNIGRQASGRLPVRRGWDGDIPQESAGNAFEWEGYIPFEDMPSLFNPPSGFVVAANQNVFPEQYPYRVHGGYAPPYRARRIADLLARRKDWDAGATLALQNDVYSPFLHFLARQLSAAVRAREAGGQTGAAAKILGAWNGQTEPELVAPLIATETFLQIRTALAERSAPGARAAARSEIVMAAVEQLLTTRPDGWFEDWDEFLVRCLSRALMAGQSKYGPDLSQWNFGRFNSVTWKSPVLGEFRLIGRFFQSGPIPQRGTSTSIHYSWGRLGQSMRLVADLGDLGNSRLNTVVGQSGQILSPHYRDELETFHSGGSYRMPFQDSPEGEVLEIVPR